MGWRIDVSALAKAYRVRFDTEDEDQVSRIFSYCKLMHRVCGVKVFLFLNLKQVLTKEELRDFYKEMTYEHLDIIDIEGLFNYRIEREACVIIDKDKCRIDLV